MTDLETTVERFSAGAFDLVVHCSLVCGEFSRFLAVQVFVRSFGESTVGVVESGRGAGGELVEGGDGESHFSGVDNGKLRAEGVLRAGARLLRR